MRGKRYQFLIVGSGAGGSTLAKELSMRGKEVLVVERGRDLRDLRYFNGSKLIRMPVRSKEGVKIWRAIVAGGSTVVSGGSATRCLEEELADLGITLDEEFAESKREMNVSPIDETLLSEGSKKIRWAAKELGYKMELMPKFIDPVRCTKCGQCTLGCTHGAKWLALDYLAEARQNGAQVLVNTTVQGVVVENGKVRGIRGVGLDGEVEILSEVVVLAAGGVGTPVILQQSGVKEAGTGLFIAPYVKVYGVTEGLSLAHEPVMALINREFHKSRGFIFAPYISPTNTRKFAEIGENSPTLSTRGLIGIMIKAADEPIGRVYPDGTVSKPVTEKDWKRLREGSAIARDILIKAGADSESIVVTEVAGAHPGGTAGIGKVVEKDLQTGIDNLFVCDASVFPTVSEMPPILTIVALAKRLAKTLAP
jgi:choline dehydrogenase-like flavoprotein